MGWYGTLFTSLRSRAASTWWLYPLVISLEIFARIWNHRCCDVTWQSYQRLVYNGPRNPFRPLWFYFRQLLAQRYFRTVLSCHLNIISCALGQLFHISLMLSRLINGLDVRCPCSNSSSAIIQSLNSVVSVFIWSRQETVSCVIKFPYCRPVIVALCYSGRGFAFKALHHTGRPA